ncbi:HDOD domain-containing protein [bacterium]|nr:HDOD domain-containing protein [bacterium]
MTVSEETIPVATDEAIEQDDQLRTLVMTIRDLPAMPHVASKVLELSSDPDTSAARLQQVISDDQAMTARILKIANSAMYACSRRIKTLSEAIVMLGFNSIRSLVVTSAARNLYSTGSARMGLKERLLWEHSIGTAFACRLLCEARHPALREEAFLAGLMHDIGKLVLNLQVPDRFEEIIQIVYNENREFHDTETELLGFDHARVGSLLVNKWKLSPLLEEVIGLHHDAANLTPDRPLLLHLDLANRLCHKLGIGFQESNDLDLCATVANRHLGFTEDELAEVAQQLQQTLEVEMEVFI